jgi:hypothetical protein
MYEKVTRRLVEYADACDLGTAKELLIDHRDGNLTADQHRRVQEVLDMDHATATMILWSLGQAESELGEDYDLFND